MYYLHFDITRLVSTKLGKSLFLVLQICLSHSAVFDNIDNATGKISASLAA